jgi:arabinofuranosyltransferase
MTIIAKASIKKSSLTRERIAILLISLSFLIWGFIFIYRTSFIAIDGHRYFCLFDDAMISMRYAWNFSHGNGLVWNAGDYVMGYTNLLMTLVMSWATLVFDKSSAVLSIQILGAGLMLGIAYTTMKIADSLLPEEKREQYPSSLVRILSFSLALLYYPLLYWTLMGMETGLLTVLLLLAVFFAIQYTKNARFSALILVSLCLGLAFMARNDSMIFAAFIWIYISWKVVRDRGGTAFLHLFLALFIYLLFVAGQILFQFLYYGDLLPNTYVLKLTGMPLADRLLNGSRFVFPFLIQTSILFTIAITGLFLSFSREKLLLLALILSAVLYQIYVGGDPWNYWRMMAPVMPLLLILFILGLVDGVSRSAQAGRGSSFLGNQREVQIGFLAFLGVLVMNAYFLPEIAFLDKPFYVSANQYNVDVALALRDVTTPDATVGVFWAGAIPYFSERPGIDFLGKSDRYIAHLPPDLSGKVSKFGINSLPGHNKYDLHYSIEELQPTYVQDFKWGGQDVSSEAMGNYARIESQGVVLYLLKDSPAVIWDRIGRQ